MQFSVSAQAFDRRDVRAFRLNREHGAGLDRSAIHHDGASAADAGFAPDVRPSQSATVSKEMNQEQAGIDFILVEGAIDSDRDARFHGCEFCKLRFVGLLTMRL